MDNEELDLSIIVATDEYNRATKTAAEPSAGNGTRSSDVAPAGAGKPSLDARITHLEAEVENWQRRTVIWRERALSTQALNEALNKNLEDLRTVIQYLPAPAQESTRESAVIDQPAARPPATGAVVEWCNRVFRREFWTGTR
jgi:hypothetical protein